MCYVVAKHADKPGSVALRTTHGPSLVALKRAIIGQVGTGKIQLVTISRPSAYGEYEPYRFVKNEEEFEREAIALNR